LLRSPPRRVSAGAVSEADFLRVQTEKLTADDAVNAAERDLRESELSLAYLLGVRGLVPDFHVDDGLLEPRVEPGLALDRREALREAFARRPDLASARKRANRASESVDLARRTRLPALGLWVLGRWSDVNAGSHPGEMVLPLESILASPPAQTAPLLL